MGQRSEKFSFSKLSFNNVMTGTVAGTAILMTAGGLSPVFAQGQEADDEIIVSSGLINRPADELISGVSVIDADQIAKSLAPSLGNSLDKLPGVASSSFGQGASRPVLRGLGAGRVLVLTNGVGVIDASATSPDHQVAADGIEAERIEILRGPAALAYGGQAIGGVVHVIDGLIATAPLDEAVSFDGYYAGNPERGDREGALRARAALGEGWVISGTLSDRDFDDYPIPGSAESLQQLIADGEEPEEGTGSLEGSFVETRSGAIGISYVTETGHIGFATRVLDSEYGIPLHEEEEEEGEEGEGEEEEGLPFIVLDQDRYDFSFAQEVGFGPFTEFSGVASLADYTHTEFEGNGEAGTVFDVEGYEARIEGAHKLGPLEGVIGIQVSDRELSAEGEEAFITPTDTAIEALFIHETWEIDGKSGLEGGLRVEQTDLDNEFQGSRDFDTVSASLGYHGHISDEAFWGVKISYSERAPSDVELFTEGVHLATQQFELGDADLDEEAGLGVESSWRWKGEAVTLGVNLFATAFEDFIFLTPGLAEDEDGALSDEIEGFPVFAYVQEDADFIGGEITAALTEPLILGDIAINARGSVDYVSAELDEGGNVPLIPPLTFNASVSAAWQGFEATLDATIAADQDDNGAGELPTDSFERFDFLLDWQIPSTPEGTKLFFHVNNFTDEEIRQATSAIKDFAPDPGRVFRTGIRISF